MVYNGVWDVDTEHLELVHERLISQLVQMLGQVQTWYGCNFKIEVLKIINFFLDEDANLRLKKILDLVKQASLYK
jgi:hypothetical protein